MMTAAYYYYRRPECHHHRPAESIPEGLWHDNDIAVCDCGRWIIYIAYDLHCGRWSAISPRRAHRLIRRDRYQAVAR